MKVKIVLHRRLLKKGNNLIAITVGVHICQKVGNKLQVFKIGKYITRKAQLRHFVLI